MTGMFENPPNKLFDIQHKLAKNRQLESFKSVKFIESMSDSPKI